MIMVCCVRFLSCLFARVLVHTELVINYSEKDTFYDTD
jgi:hypothetical protein